LRSSQFKEQKALVGAPLGALMKMEADATQKVMADEGISHIVIEVQDQSPKVQGALFMFFQLVVGVLGESLQINAYEQPEVELGKSLVKPQLIQ